jgi:hypothetical protein
MNFVRSSAQLTRRGCSRAVAGIAVRRRLAAVCTAALAVGLAGAGFTAAPASAATSTLCLDADAQQVYPGGLVEQWSCNPDDPFQNWVIVPEGSYLGHTVYEIQNLGALYDDDAADCLEADGQQVYPGGAVIQSGCVPNDDANVAPYEEWFAVFTADGAYQWQNFGALLYNDAADCLDADAQQEHQGGPLIQWGCNSNDIYQQWTTGNGGDNGSLYINVASD